MLSRLQHLLLLTLFVSVHLVVQPFASVGRCVGAMALDGDCCCSMSDAAAPSPGSGCCGEVESASSAPSDAESVESGCACVASPKAPTPPYRNEVLLTSLDAGDAVHELERSPLFSCEWPSVDVRGARPPNEPPRVAGELEPAFTQVFRL